MQSSGWRLPVHCPPPSQAGASSVQGAATQWLEQVEWDLPNAGLSTAGSWSPACSLLVDFLLRSACEHRLQDGSLLMQDRYVLNVMWDSK